MKRPTCVACGRGLPDHEWDCRIQLATLKEMEAFDAYWGIGAHRAEAARLED